mgnify:FL=1
MKNYEELKEYIISGRHRELRREVKEELAKEYSLLGLTPAERMTRRFCFACENETPVVFKNERIA